MKSQATFNTSKLNIDVSKPVLVTGATGYVAGVTIKQLLEHGVTVHATVRDPTNTQRLQYLQQLADKSPGGKIKFFAGDLLKMGSFKDAMEGCEIVFHMASPFTVEVHDPQKELIDPAVLGTENVLLQANQTPTVKRVIVTSSVMAIHSDNVDGNDLTEETWNRTSSLTHNPYALSKTLAEQKAWVIAGSQKQWTLVTICPSFVCGPGLKYSKTSESYQLVKQMGSNDPAMAAGLPNLGMIPVDVRDVATAHIVAAYTPGASGRYIASPGKGYMWPELGKILGNDKYCNFKAKGYPIVTKAAPLPKFMFWLLGPYVAKGLTRKWVWNNIGFCASYDTTKSKVELGMKYRPVQVTLGDMYQQLIDEGIVSSTNSQKK